MALPLVVTGDSEQRLGGPFWSSRTTTSCCSFLREQLAPHYPRNRRRHWLFVLPDVVLSDVM